MKPPAGCSAQTLSDLESSARRVLARGGETDFLPNAGLLLSIELRQAEIFLDSTHTEVLRKKAALSVAHMQKVQNLEVCSS